MNAPRHLRSVPRAPEPRAPQKEPVPPTVLEECRDTLLGRTFEIVGAEYTGPGSMRIHLGARKAVP